jgi:hypothetical protein
MANLFCLKSKTGYLFPETIETTKTGVWFNGGFSIVAQSEGHEWESRYWKRAEVSMAWALRHGWGIVEVDVTETKR